MLLKSLREQVIETCLHMLSDGFSLVSEGNVSARDPESGLIAITPTAIPYLKMRTKDVCIIDVNGKHIKGKWRPTSEIALHTILYQQRPDVFAVVHTHAPYASTFAISGDPLPMVLTESAMVLGGDVPVAPYSAPGTLELATVTAAALGAGPAALMAHHGLISVGVNLSHAYETTLAAEQSARMVYMLRSMNLPFNALSAEVVKELHGAYLKKYHPTKA